jgi:hypothetical protein
MCASCRSRTAANASVGLATKFLSSAGSNASVTSCADESVCRQRRKKTP